jgi:hypothetical protein
MSGSVKVGEQVRIRADGGSPAARKHAGAEGRVRLVCEGSDRTIFDVRIFGNNFDTVLEEGDLLAAKGEEQTTSMGLFSGLESQSNLNRLLEELFGKNGVP